MLFNQHDLSSLPDSELLTSAQVIVMLQVSKRWLAYNRNSQDPIPYKKFGRFIRYEKKKIMAWLKKQTLKNQGNG